MQGLRPEGLENCIALWEEGHMGNPNMVSGVTGEMPIRLPWSGPHLLSHLFSTLSLYSNRCLPSGLWRWMRTCLFHRSTLPQ